MENLNLIRCNKLIIKYFQENGIKVESNLEYTLPSELEKILIGGTIEVNGAYFFSYAIDRDSSINSDSDDIKPDIDNAELEYSLNEINIEDYTGEESFKEIILATVVFAKRLANELRTKKKHFRVTGCIQNDDFITGTVRFYMIRPDEVELINDDPDVYQDDGLFIIDVNKK